MISLNTTMKLFTVMLEYGYSMIWLFLEGMAGEKRRGEFGYIKYIFTCLLSIGYEEADMEKNSGQR